MPPPLGEFRFAAIAERTLAFLYIYWGVGHGQVNAGSESLYLLRAPYAGRNATWLLCENGGEVNLWMPNTDVHLSIPYTAWRLPLSAATMAYRLAQPIFGGRIDWAERWEDQELMPSQVWETERRR